MPYPKTSFYACNGGDILRQVIVVDVEDRDDSVWHNLTPIDGGLSGWRLLWDRWCPIPALRCQFLNTRLPSQSTPTILF